MTRAQSTGIRQRHILETMHAHGGVWPPAWRIKSDHRHIFESLMHRGLIHRAWVGRNYTYRLTRSTP